MPTIKDLQNKVDREISEAMKREDSVWTPIHSFRNTNKKIIIEWSEIDSYNGDFKEADEIIMVGIPIKKDKKVSLDLAQRYLQNEIRIFKLKEENSIILKNMNRQI